VYWVGIRDSFEMSPIGSGGKERAGQKINASDATVQMESIGHRNESDLGGAFDRNQVAACVGLRNFFRYSQK
jgi:hypothetical protein